MIEADRVIAVIGKTEGNGGVNDYTRIIADRAFREVLVEKGTRSAEEVKQIPIVWSGGTDGVISPHATIFATARAARRADRRAAADASAIAMSDVILPEDIGRPPMVEKVAEGVREAMEAAGITDPADVHYVQTKTPAAHPRHHQRRQVARPGRRAPRNRTSMDLSNGTTALGIAVALGEIEMPPTEQITRDLSLFSSVASCSSGVELDQAQIVVVGNVRGIGGNYRIGHSVMKDALDEDGIWDGDPQRRPRPARAAAPAPTSATGWSTSSSSARPTRPAGSAAGATSCSTTPTCTGTARSRRPSAGSRPR